MAALLEATRPALKDVLGKVYSMSRDQVMEFLLVLQNRLLLNGVCSNGSPHITEGRHEIISQEYPCVRFLIEQVGCRLLQQKLDECPDRPPDGDVGKEGASKNAGAPPAEEDAVTAIFEEALPDLPQMMVDPFGNYLFQKLFVKIDDHQRLLAVSSTFSFHWNWFWRI